MAKYIRFRKGADTARKGEKNLLVGKIFCGGCGKPLRGKNKYRRFECRKHAVLQIPECCTCFSADLLEETVLTMLNRELMVHGDAAKENQSLVSFQKSCIARLEKKITGCRGRKKQLQAETDALYESYAFGTVQAVSYRRKADSIKEQIASLSVEEKYGKELEQIQEECHRTKEDMKQVIRYSHLEVLTQEVVDKFVKKIYVLKIKELKLCGISAKMERR